MSIAQSFMTIARSLPYKFICTADWDLVVFKLSIIDCLDAEPLKRIKVIPHALKRLWRVSLPV